MLKDGQLICDRCGKVISRLTAPPEGDAEKMHNLCSACFTELEKQAVSRN